MHEDKEGTRVKWEGERVAPVIYALEELLRVTKNRITKYFSCA